MATVKKHTTDDIVVVFARQGIPLSVISRALAVAVDKVLKACRKAHSDGELAMIPPINSDNIKHGLLVEITNLRAQLDDARFQIRQLSVAEKPEMISAGRVFGLTPKEARILTTLLRRETATRTTLYHALYDGAMDVGERDPKIIDVFICKLRKKLRPHGIVVDNVWGSHYSMDAENKAKLRALIAVPETVTSEAA